jgi:hypothetical protein
LAVAFMPASPIISADAVSNVGIVFFLLFINLTTFFCGYCCLDPCFVCPADLQGNYNAKLARAAVPGPIGYCKWFSTYLLDATFQRHARLNRTDGLRRIAELLA